MSSRSYKRRQRQHRKDKKRRRARHPGPGLGNFVVVEPPGMAKMSDALWALVEPDYDGSSDDDRLRKLLTLGSAAWNAALVQGAERTALLEHLAETLPEESRPEFLAVIEPFIRRKEKLFPHIQRPILSFDLTWLPSGEPYLSVVSGLA